MTARGKSCGDVTQRRQIPCRQFDHHAHQIHAPDLFGDAVLHLQTGIHFEEIELSGVAVIDKLHRPGAAILHRLPEANGGVAQRLRHTRRQARRRGFLQHFLITPLHGAVTHAEGNHIALPVAKDLHFEVARPWDVFFNKHPRIAEVVYTQTLDHVEGFRQRLRVSQTRMPIPPPPAVLFSITG